jgi:hypothetical protein
VDFLGHDDAGKIFERDMIHYKEHLLKDPALSQKTVAGHLDDLRTIFRFAAKNKKIPADPLADVWLLECMFLVVKISRLIPGSEDASRPSLCGNLVSAPECKIFEK